MTLFILKDKMSEIVKLNITDCQMNELDAIVTWQERLKLVNVENIEPLFNILDETLVCQTVEDIAMNNSISEVLSNAKNVENNFVTVPQIITRDE